MIAGDAGKQADCKRCVEGTISAFGGLDVIIANAGWTKFTEFADLEAMTEGEWDKCWATNVKGPKFLVSAALPTFKANPEGGAVIITSSVAAQSLGGSSMAYSVTKAAQVHLMKCMAQTQGKEVRINAVLPGLLLTDWGLVYGDERIKMLKDRAALKKEVSLSQMLLGANGCMSGRIRWLADRLITVDRAGRLRRHVRVHREEYIYDWTGCYCW